MPPEMTMHPEGNYTAEVMDHGFNAARTGTVQLWITFGTEHGTITAYLPLTDAAADSSLRKLTAIGYDGSNLAELSDGSVLRGRRCVITVRHSEWQGRISAKVEWINPEGWTPGPMRDDTAAANASKFNGLLAKIQQDKAKQSKGDLPF